MNIPDATLPDLPPGTKLNFKTLREWLEELLYRIISKIGGGVGKPDLVNETLNLIYDIKSGDLDAAGRSDWPNDVTVGKGFGQVLWYSFWASLAKGHPIYDNGRGPWKPGDLENDKPLANGLTKCGGVCVIPGGPGVELQIAFGGPGVLVYRVIDTGAPKVSPTPKYVGLYNRLSAEIQPIIRMLPVLIAAALAGAASGYLGGGGFPPVLVGSGGGCSFTPDTMVRTPGGGKALGQLLVGDQVLAYTPIAQRVEVQPILHVWSHVDSDLVNVMLVPLEPSASLANERGELLHTTSRHPFLTKEAGFVPAGQLQIGMHVVQGDGNMGVVMMIQVVPGSMIMYNLEVAQDHTFLVSYDQWVVHNNCGPDFGGIP